MKKKKIKSRFILKIFPLKKDVFKKAKYIVLVFREANTVQ